MGLLAGIARILLVVINIIFLLSGLALVAVGFLLRFGQSVYEPVLEFGLHQLQKVVDNTKLGQFQVEDINLGEALQNIAIGLIVGGIVLCALAFLGCCGACYQYKLLLWTYAIIIVVFVLVEAVGIGLLYGKPELVKDHTKTTLDNYSGLGGQDVNTILWNIVMIQFKCCGVDSYKDFSSSLPWASPSVSPASPGSSVTLATPIACCKNLPTGTNDLMCAQTYNETTSNGMAGCYDILWKLSFANTSITVPVLVVGGVIQAAFIFLAIMIAKDDKDKVSPI